MRTYQIQRLPSRNSLRALPGTAQFFAKSAEPAAFPASLLRAITDTTLPGRNHGFHGSTYAERLRRHRCNGWDTRDSLATPEPRAKAGHSVIPSTFEIRHSSLPVFPPRSPQNISPGDPAAAGPLEQPLQIKRSGRPWEWLPDKIRKQQRNN